ncbi:hypothetical protein HYR54_02000 [Candidatus Acetothermia bacterium]|nr:hypothetical protein [Candidatus Acetothermia bacterium]
MGQQGQTSITISNSGGGTLTGTASVGTPFSIVSGASYGLQPGQPATIVVNFNPTTAGYFNGTLHMVAGALVQDISLAGSTLSVNPTQLNFAALVGGSPQDQVFTVTNNAPATWYDAGGKAIPVTTSFTVSTSVPYSLVSPTGNSFTLSGGQSQQGIACPVFAEPFAFQCQLPMRPAVIQTPVPLPTNGQFIIKFQRFAGESSFATIGFSGIRGDHKRFLERIAQEINNESAQRPPKLAAVRERGLDQVRTESVANITVVALDEIFRLLLVYDRSAMTVAFEGPSGYTIAVQYTGPSA